MSAARTCLVALLVAGCGTGGEQDSVARYQPISGVGPYHRIAADSPLAPQSAPFVIDDVRENLDEPSVIVRKDGRISVWFTVHRNGKRRIERADSNGDSLRFDDPVVALQADLDWEQGEVSGASLVLDAHGLWLLFYAAGGAIGVAISDDGDDWTKLPAHTLRANGSDEGNTLVAPAAVVIEDRCGSITWRVRAVICGPQRRCWETWGR